MNNPKLSATTTSTDAFTEAHIYGYPPPWDGLPKEHLQDNKAFNNGRDSYSTVEIDCSDASSLHDLPDRETTQVQPFWRKVRRFDLGLWLLCGSAIRQRHWERLREAAQGTVAFSDSTPDCFSNLKRSCDIVGSIFFLITLFPLFILIAILIKLDSPGPVFFQHSRVGWKGQHFVLWKFRSMRADVPKYATSPQSSTDDRLTRVGRTIRRFSIDEIPQLINVLKGEMSLVGPRPEMPFIVDLYRPAECQRFAVRPGITGLWQISPARALPIHKNLQFDFHYIHNQNFILDCAIIMRTITAVIHGVGAI